MQSTMHTIKQFELGNTIYFEHDFRNLNLDLVDPLDPAYAIKTATGITVASSGSDGGPFKRATGYWYFRFTSTTPGDFYCEWTGTVEGHAVTYRKPFKVINSTKKY